MPSRSPESAGPTIDAHLEDDLRHGGGRRQVAPLDHARAPHAMRAVLEKPVRPAASALTT